MACATQTQFRRGTAAANSTFTGVEGEVTYATDTHRLYTHDGITVGGFALALFSDIATQARLALSVSAPLTYNSGTGAFAITLADTTHNGYLSSADWNTFNGKQAALGFTPENVTNKSNDTTFAADSATLYPTQHAVKTGLASKQSTTAPGSDKQVIFNDGNAFGASSGFTFDKASGNTFIGGTVSVNGNIFLIGTDGAASFAAGTIQLNADSSASFSNGNIHFDTDGSANFAGVTISASETSIQAGGVLINGGSLGGVQATGDIANDPHALREDGSFTLNSLTMDSSGVIIGYHGDVTSANGLVSVVGFYDQSTNAAIGLTTLFTPPNTGLFEVSVVRLVTATATSGNLDVNLSWTDEVGATTLALPALSVASVTRDSFTVMISVTGTNAIRFQTFLNIIVGGPPTYRIKVSVRRIQ